MKSISDGRYICCYLWEIHSFTIYKLDQRSSYQKFNCLKIKTKDYQFFILLYLVIGKNYWFMLWNFNSDIWRIIDNFWDLYKVLDFQIFPPALHFTLNLNKSSSSPSQLYSFSPIFSGHLSHLSALITFFFTMTAPVKDSVLIVFFHSSPSSCIYSFFILHNLPTVLITLLIYIICFLCPLPDRTVGGQMQCLVHFYSSITRLDLQ